MAVEIHLGGEQSTGIASGNGTVRKEGAVVVGRATLSNGKAAFSMEDRGAVSGGSAVGEPQADCDRFRTGSGNPFGCRTGGALNLPARRLSIREDYPAAPRLRWQRLLPSLIRRELGCGLRRYPYCTIETGASARRRRGARAANTGRPEPGQPAVKRSAIDGGCGRGLPNTPEASGMR